MKRPSTMRSRLMARRQDLEFRKRRMARRRANRGPFVHFYRARRRSR